jgi:membrane protease YdiL (CAAX protease family)
MIFGMSERLSGVPALMLQIVIMLLPLTACALPVFMGVPWSTARREMGLHDGAGWLREIGYGFVVYATAIPMLVVGGVLAFLLALLTQSDLEGASHPIQQELFDGSAGERLMLFVIAVVLAPVVEEIVFRGVLFVHLRELALRWGRFAAFAVSALASSLIFAAMHPQGVVFIPVLGALAVAFCLAREMRGSLVSCMVAHGINNALIVGLNVAMSA